MGDDLEAEEVELGDDKDLAADVDDGLYDQDDPEDLESDEEDEKFGGLDMEEDTDGELSFPLSRLVQAAVLTLFSIEPMHILPLYSLLPTEKQMKVFADPPPNTRLVVIATNVAETSITIPNVKYVVDAGRAKEVSHSKRTFISCALWTEALPSPAPIRRRQRYSVVRGRVDLKSVRCSTIWTSRSNRTRPLLPPLLIGRLRELL